MPGVVKGANFAPELQRTPLAARAGVYIAYPAGYPSATSVRLWKVGGSKSRMIAYDDGDHLATVAATADGRLWIVRTGEADEIEAVRTNKAATRLGATIVVAPPVGTQSVYRLDASAAASGAVDVLALTDAGADATWQRLLPGLTLSAKPAHPVAATKAKFKVRVLDAGAPVAGAKVTVVGRAAKTDKAGRATLTVAVGAHAEQLLVTARKAGYTAARLRAAVEH